MIDIAYNVVEDMNSAKIPAVVQALGVENFEKEHYVSTDKNDGAEGGVVVFTAFKRHDLVILAVGAVDCDEDHFRKTGSGDTSTLSDRPSECAITRRHLSQVVVDTGKKYCSDGAEIIVFKIPNGNDRTLLQQFVYEKNDAHILTSKNFDFFDIYSAEQKYGATICSKKAQEQIEFWCGHWIVEQEFNVLKSKNGKNVVISPIGGFVIFYAKDSKLGIRFYSQDVIEKGTSMTKKKKKRHNDDYESNNEKGIESDSMMISGRFLEMMIENTEFEFLNLADKDFEFFDFSTEENFVTPVKDIQNGILQMMREHIIQQTTNIKNQMVNFLESYSFRKLDLKTGDVFREEIDHAKTGKTILFGQSSTHDSLADIHRLVNNDKNSISVTVSDSFRTRKDMHFDNITYFFELFYYLENIYEAEVCLRFPDLSVDENIALTHLYSISLIDHNLFDHVGENARTMIGSNNEEFSIEKSIGFDDRNPSDATMVKNKKLMFYANNKSVVTITKWFRELKVKELFCNLEKNLKLTCTPTNESNLRFGKIWK